MLNSFFPFTARLLKLSSQPDGLISYRQFSGKNQIKIPLRSARSAPQPMRKNNR
jgi:hypothetical protein